MTALFVAAWCAAAALTGCEVSAAPPPTPVPTNPPTLTPTSVVTFEVAVTPLVKRARHHPPPTPQPTRFVPPSGPYITLSPASGPPIDRTITVAGAHFPHASAVTIVWALDGRLTPLSTTGFTDSRGNLRATLSVPASVPGRYRVQASVQGVAYARAYYHIVSAAQLDASITQTPTGSTLSVFGKKFVPGFQLTLIAYSTVAGRPPVALGNVQVNAHGRFSFSGPVDRLEPGQYILRAWSVSSLAAEMAQTFFEVVV